MNDEKEQALMRAVYLLVESLKKDCKVGVLNGTMETQTPDGPVSDSFCIVVVRGATDVQMLLETIEPIRSTTRRTIHIEGDIDASGEKLPGSDHV